MWDNPRLLNSAAGFLVGIAFLLFALGGAQLVLRSNLFPVRSVVVTTSLINASPEAVETAVRTHFGGNFFAARIDELRAALEEVPWVRTVTVRRVWPDALQVAVEEHVALARLGDEALVNTYGERFVAPCEKALPIFVAPAGAEAEVALRYAAFTRLLEPIGSPVERITLTPRYAWQVQLANGVQFWLGRDGALAEDRLRRFMELRPAVFDSARAYDTVDLRYSNGFALRVKG